MCLPIRKINLLLCVKNTNANFFYAFVVLILLYCFSLLQFHHMMMTILFLNRNESYFSHTTSMLILQGLFSFSDFSNYFYLFIFLEY